MNEPTATAHAQARARLLSLRVDAAHWQGRLSSSALSTATAIVALHGVDAGQHRTLIDAGARWLVSAPKRRRRLGGHDAQQKQPFHHPSVLERPAPLWKNAAVH